MQFWWDVEPKQVAAAEVADEDEVEAVGEDEGDEKHQKIKCHNWQLTLFENNQ